MSADPLDALANLLVTLANGLLGIFTATIHPVFLGGVVAAACLLWLAGIEIEELDRAGTKPMVGRH